MPSIHDGVTYKEYVYLNGMKVAVVENGVINYIHNNYLGVPAVITDASANVVWKGDYKPFGEMYDVNGTLSNNIRFPGQYQNEESGYSYNYFRDYDPTIGRYLQSDPIGLNGGINTYGYVGGNPVSYSDPKGLWAVGDPISQGFVDFSAGLGDGLTLGLGELLRNKLNINSVDNCSTEYSAGSWSSLAFGSARMAYAGSVKGYSLIAPSGLAASKFRNGAKNAFRLGLGKKWRKTNTSKYKNDNDLRKAAGKTNRPINAYGTGVTATSGQNLNENK